MDDKKRKDGGCEATHALKRELQALVSLVIIVDYGDRRLPDMSGNG